MGRQPFGHSENIPNRLISQLENKRFNLILQVVKITDNQISYLSLISIYKIYSQQYAHCKYLFFNS